MQTYKIITVLLLAVLLSATRSTATPGVSTSDGSDGAGAAVQTDPAAKAGGVVRYLVPHIRSASFATGIGGRVTTVISATNGGTTACDVSVDFYFAFNSDTLPECTVNVSLAPLLESGSDTTNVCSRSISGDRWTLCTATCNPSLSFIQGKAIIQVPESCAGAVSFDARLYHSDTAEDIRAINALKVTRLND